MKQKSQQLLKNSKTLTHDTLKTFWHRNQPTLPKETMTHKKARKKRFYYINKTPIEEIKKSNHSLSLLKELKHQYNNKTKIKNVNTFNLKNKMLYHKKRQKSKRYIFQKNAQIVPKSQKTNNFQPPNKVETSHHHFLPQKSSNNAKLLGTAPKSKQPSIISSVRFKSNFLQQKPLTQALLIPPNQFTHYHVQPFSHHSPPCPISHLSLESKNCSDGMFSMLQSTNKIGPSIPLKHKMHKICW